MTSSQHKDITQLTHVAGVNSKPRLTLKMRIVVARGLLVLLFGLGFFLSMIPSGRATTRAALLLPSLITAAEPALLRSVNESIQHTQKVLPSRVGTLYLDVYAPSSSPSPIPGVRGGVVIIPGVGDNREVPQLVNFAQSLARTGLVVMIMTTPTLIKYDLSVQDSDAVFDAFNALTQLNHPHDFVEFDIFRHVQVRSGLGIDQLVSDGLNLFRLLRNVLLISS